MYDIKWIHNNPQIFNTAMKNRKSEITAEILIKIDIERRKIMTQYQNMLTLRKKISSDIGIRRNNGENTDSSIAEMNLLKLNIKDAYEKQLNLNHKLKLMLSSLPNIPDPDVPIGFSESDNKEIYRWGKPRKFNFIPQEHFKLGEKLRLMDFETAANISGSRFVILRGQLAQLERALSQFMIDLHTKEHGYEETNIPVLVREHAMFGTGQLPKFNQSSFHTTNNMWLIPTSEVPLTNQIAGKIIDHSQLPLRYTALTQCFRSEAGSAGRDTRGMLRQHQFSKVELVSFVCAENSENELSRIIGCAQTVLERLELPYRTMILCTGDLGFTATKTYDIEVWLPGQSRYREISSCSNTRDFQSRRMQARYRIDQRTKPQFFHTLNGSGVAIGRCLIAIMENYQQDDGSIEIPKVLQPYMNGLKIITLK